MSYQLTVVAYIVSLSVFIAFPSHGQDIKQRAAEIQKWRTTFSDPDPTIRLAALEQVVQSTKDPSLRALAIESTLKADDPVVQAAALLHLLPSMKTLNVAPVEKGPTLFLTVDTFDPSTGKFKAMGIWRLPGDVSRGCAGNLATIQGHPPVPPCSSLTESVPEP
jgi:hypothetical protein